MPTPPIPPEKVRQVEAMLREGVVYDEIKRRTGVSHGSISKIRKNTKIPERSRGAGDGQSTRDLREAADGSAVLSLHTENPVKTLEDAVRVAEVDPSTWLVDRWECSQWTVPVKVEQGQDPATKLWQASVPLQTQQYRVKLYLRRIVPRAIKAALDAVYERMAGHAPRYPKPDRERPAKTEPFMAIFALFDAHFGKLCWRPETGTDYDLKIAETLYRNAVEDLLAESRHRPVGRILLPVGNDFFHIDNRKNTTYRGTPQDVDGRYAKVFEAGLAAVVWAVESLAAVAPVQVVWVPGNHDPTMSYHLAATVAAWFRNCPRVEADTGPAVRKYVAWGATLIGLTHGDAPRPEDLPSLMATERPAEWAAARCREWLIGHQHRSRQWVTKPVDTHRGTVVRVTRSLAGTDAWHFENGYVNPDGAAAEVYWYGRDRGYAGHAVVPARYG